MEIRRRSNTATILTTLSTVSEIKFLAKVYGWVETTHDTKTQLLSFTRKGKVVNVWYGTMTVGTFLHHPRKGKTQLFRKNVSMKLLEFIFNNPRLHTGKGYYTRDQAERL